MGDGIRFYSAGGWSIVAIILLICLVVLLIPLLFLGLIGAAFARLGFSWIAAVAVIILMILGRAINIPLWKIQRDMVRLDHNGESGGNGYEPWETVISLNLGGAVIPIVIAVYLLVISNGSTGVSIGVPVIVSVILVAALSYIVTRRVQGTGLRVPLFMPGLTALLCGFVLAGGVGLAAGVTAFVAGTFGTLLGANVANLYRIRDLGVDGFSIGGAGTFGAVFISCILSALIA